MHLKDKYLNLIIVISISLLFSSIPVLSVDDNIKLPKTGHRKPSILFSHKSHTENYGAKCIDCHHKGKNKKCSSCHLKRDKGKIIKLKGAFHQQCRNCHREKNGPRGCGKCHIKNRSK